MPIFREQEDRTFFLWILSEFSERFEVNVHAYCLMTNHFHLITEGSVDRLADAMHRLGSLFTRYFNDRADVDGPLFRSRYYSNPILDEDYFRNALRYVHRNPEAIDPQMALSAYPWSSHAAYLGRRSVPWLETARALELFGGSRQTYREFVERESDQPTRSDVLLSVANAAGVSVDQVLTRKAGSANTPATASLLLLSEFLGESNAQLADLLGIAPGAVRTCLCRARAKLSEGGELAKLYTAASVTLEPVPSVTFGVRR